MISYLVGLVIVESQATYDVCRLQKRLHNSYRETDKVSKQAAPGATLLQGSISGPLAVETMQSLLCSGILLGLSITLLYIITAFHSTKTGY